MGTVRFFVHDKVQRVQFIKGIFLLADTSIEVILEIFFFSFNNATINFEIEKLT